MENDDDLFLLMAAYLKRIKKQKRKYWVHPINSARLLKGTFYTLYEDLKADNNKFFAYFRMSSSTFEEIVAKIRTGILKQDTIMRLSIPPEEVTAIAIR